MNLADILLKAFTGRKLTAREQQEAQESLDEIARQFMTSPPPAILSATDGEGRSYRFHYQGFRAVRPGEWHLCGMPPALRADAPRGIHRCHVYDWLAATGPGTSQKQPPPPQRPSRAAATNQALQALGFGEPVYSTVVWPPPRQEIRARFVALSKQFHPDTHPGDAEAERRYKEITAAYTLLKAESLA